MPPLGAKRSSAAIIGPAQFRITTTIPICSGIGIKPATAVILSEPVRGASVSFKDFTLGWAELHRFMGVNEQPTAIAIMIFEAGASAWTQYVGPCIAGVETADLATAWEIDYSGVRRNYAL